MKCTCEDPKLCTCPIEPAASESFNEHYTRQQKNLVDTTAINVLVSTGSLDEAKKAVNVIKGWFGW